MKNRESSILLFSLFSFFFAIGANLHAEDMTVGKTSDLTWHGFISQGYIRSTHNNYLGESHKGSFNFSEVALNVTKSLDHKIDLGAQLFARKFGPNENFNTKFDWFYANYQHTNWIKIKVGRIKIPYGLYNDISDIDSARVSILLPQSVYPSQNRNYLLAQNGIQLYGFGDVSKMGSLGYHIYAGSINLDLPPVTNTNRIITQIDTPYIYGGRLLWETPKEGLKTAFTIQTLNLKLHINEASVPVNTDLPVTLGLVSVEYLVNKLKLASEYGRQYVEVKSSPELFPHTKTTSEKYYLLANYQLTDTFSPGLYYSMLTPNVRNRGNHEKKQRDVALFCRYDFNPNWLIKFEGHLMNGTGGLSSALNNNLPLSSLKNNWQVFLVKTTANF